MQSLNSRASAIGMMNEELNAAGEGLAGNEDLLRSVLAGCGDCIKILDLEGRLRFMSEGGKQIMEVEDFSKVEGSSVAGFLGRSRETGRGPRGRSGKIRPDHTF
jgi:hypothetical protein